MAISRLLSLGLAPRTPAARAPEFALGVLEAEYAQYLTKFNPMQSVRVNAIASSINPQLINN